MNEILKNLFRRHVVRRAIDKYRGPSNAVFLANECATTLRMIKTIVSKLGADFQRELTPTHPIISVLTQYQLLFRNLDSLIECCTDQTDEAIVQEIMDEYKSVFSKTVAVQPVRFKLAPQLFKQNECDKEQLEKFREGMGDLKFIGPGNPFYSRGFSNYDEAAIQKFHAFVDIHLSIYTAMNQMATDLSDRSLVSALNEYNMYARANERVRWIPPVRTF